MAYAGQPYSIAIAQMTDSMKPSATPWRFRSRPRISKRLDLSTRPEQSADIGFLLQRARQSCLLPFGYLVDQCAKSSNEAGPNDYNKAWWTCAKIPGVTAPAPRSEQDFDAGPNTTPGTPYARYFLAAILQFHSSSPMPEAYFQDRSINARSTETKKAGEKLKQMLAISKPWPKL